LFVFDTLLNEGAGVSRTLEFRNIRKEFPGVKALNNVSFNAVEERFLL